MILTKKTLMLLVYLFLATWSCGSNGGNQEKASTIDTTLSVVSDTLVEAILPETGRELDIQQLAKPEIAVDSGDSPIDKLDRQASTKRTESTEYAHYDMENYTEMWSLNSDLIEISGISINSSDQFIYAVNDEQGIVYKLNKENGTILDKLKFGKSGDYEGVEELNGMVYILKSNGNLYKYNPQLSKAEVIKTALSQANDVEGLGKTLDGKYLLLACKGRPTLKKGEKIKKEKNIYAFNIATQSLMDTPYAVVKDSELLAWVDRHIDQDQYSKKALKTIKHRLKSFSPAGIAVNPVNHKTYIVSTQGKTMVVLNEDRQISRVYLLNQKVHAQPEGISFDSKGNLYISNEGRGLVARLYRYDMRTSDD